ncbi:hypothetical protein Tco_1572910, partial [Tanacetum coccineum]
MTPNEINDIISAELPSPTEDPDGYKVVSEFMLHGPCDKDAKYAPCTTEGKCSKHYPKVFLAKTVIDEDGYPIYRRKDNKVTAKNGKFTYNNQQVVPYNRYLLLKYQARINVEWRTLQPLNYHLLNQNVVILRDSENLSALLEREGINITMFTDWFELNKRDPAARAFT